MKFVTILVGLILIAGGIWLCFLWPKAVLAFIEGAVALGLILIGLGAVFFGMSEIRSAAEEARAAAQAPPAPPSTEGQKPAGQA